MLNNPGRLLPLALCLGGTLLAILPLVAITCSAAEDGVATAAVGDGAATTRVVVTLVPRAEAPGAAEDGPARRAELAALETAIRDSDVLRRYLPRIDGFEVRLEVESRRLDPEPRPSPRPAGAPADVEIHVAPLPAPEAIRDLASGLPVELGGDRLRFDGTLYEERSIAGILRLPGDPSDGPVRWLVTGADPARVAEAANRLLARSVGVHFWGGDPGRDADYEIRQSRWLHRHGRWRRQGDRWAIDRRAERDRIGERSRWLAELEPIEAGPVRLMAPLGGSGSAEGRGPGELARELGRSGAAMVRRLERTGSAVGGLPVTVVIERDFVAQARGTNDIGPAVPGGPADLHVVHHPDDRWAVHQALAKVLLARAGLTGEGTDGEEPPPVWAVEGTAGWLRSGSGSGPAAGWYGRPLGDWLPLLAAADALPTAEELLAPERTGDDSAPLWTPVATAVVDRLPGETPAEKLAAFRRPAVERALAAVRADALGASDGAAGGAPQTGSAVLALPDGFLRGVSLAHPNSVDGGYHAPAIGDRLDELAALGADSVALMPFAYQPDPAAPGLRFLNGSPTSEHDDGTIHAVRVAHARGLTVLWKPHLWIGHESWPGEVEMTSEEDWAAWWHTYRRFILHHALLAEYAGADLFSVGVELERTVERPEWAELIADVRRLYSGPVTYSANWAGGAERAVFWDRLDAVGVDAYYPLAGTAEGVSEERLAAGADRVVDRLRALAGRTGRPILLTEVGFAAREAAWIEPYKQGGTLSEADQARAYRALLGALERALQSAEPFPDQTPDRNPPWLRGIYVWKAFSDHQEWRPPGPDFRFLGRPAETEI
ncbi:MAG: hypothetical protein PVG07_03875, partial [Acidobacteriota bacterium]